MRHIHFLSLMAQGLMIAGLLAATPVLAQTKPLTFRPGTAAFNANTAKAKALAAQRLAQQQAAANNSKPAGPQAATNPRAALDEVARLKALPPQPLVDDLTDGQISQLMDQQAQQHAKDPRGPNGLPLDTNAEGQGGITPPGNNLIARRKLSSLTPYAAPAMAGVNPLALLARAFLPTPAYADTPAPNCPLAATSSSYAFKIKADAFSCAVVGGQNTIYGIDVSHHNFDTVSAAACTAAGVPTGAPSSLLSSFLQINFRADKTAYVYIKTTQNTSGYDAQFCQDWPKLAALASGGPIHRGAYHFLSANPSIGNFAAAQAQDGKNQADFFVAQLVQSGGMTARDIRPALDVEADYASTPCPVTGNSYGVAISSTSCEEDQWKTLSSAVVKAKIDAFVAEVAASYCNKAPNPPLKCPAPLIYSAIGWWQLKFAGATYHSQFADNNLWLAHYTSRPSPVSVSALMDPFALWQFSGDKASITSNNPGGYSKIVDVDVFLGTPADFAARMNTAPLVGD